MTDLWRVLRCAQDATLWRMKICAGSSGDTPEDELHGANFFLAHRNPFDEVGFGAGEADAFFPLTNL
jgi:hypothetical protein